MMSAVTAPAIRYCPIAVPHPFDPPFAPYQPQSDWVKALDTEEEEYVLLLCPHSNQEWVVWRPSQGETVMAVQELCRLPQGH